MFGRRKQQTDRERAEPADIFLDLRSKVLNLDPVTVGLAATDEHPVWGCLMETGYPNGTATLVCLSDGTTSLYTSSGGGIIGGGQHAAVAEQTAGLLQEVESHLAEMTEANGDALPASGETVIRAMTWRGQRTFQAPEVELGEGRSALSPVFHAAHRVITQLRLVEEGRQ